MAELTEEQVNKLVEEKLKAARKEFATSGGNALVKKYGTEHMSRIRKEAWERRKKKEENKQP